MSTRGLLLMTLLNDNYKNIILYNNHNIWILIEKFEDMLNVMLYNDDYIIVSSYISTINKMYNLIYNATNIHHVSIIYNDDTKFELYNK